MLEPSTGAKRYEHQTTRIVTANGSITANPDDLARCSECNEVYHHSVITTCKTCGTTLGRLCCVKHQTIPRCRKCRKKLFWRTVWETILSLG